MNNLKEAIQVQLEKISLGLLNQYREEFGQRYRDENFRKVITKGSGRFLETDGHRLAYLATRMPATFSVICKVFQEITRRFPFKMETLLDLGAGPGTVMWACSEIFPDLQKVTMIEQDENFIHLGKKLSAHQTHPLFKVSNWIQGNLTILPDMESHDCIALSYSLGELPEESQIRLIELCWNATKKIVVIIEPGTPYGFKTILRAREQLISKGANIIAPCPHANLCPLAAIGEWCHFSERLERSAEHRFLKEGQLGYEDEKFSYLIVSKTAAIPYHERIVHQPKKRSGHIHFTLCTAEGLKQTIVSKKEGHFYKEAKKLEWGDVLN